MASPSYAADDISLLVRRADASPVCRKLRCVQVNQAQDLRWNGSQHRSRAAFVVTRVDAKARQAGTGKREVALEVGQTMRLIRVAGDEVLASARKTVVFDAGKCLFETVNKKKNLLTWT